MALLTIDQSPKTTDTVLFEITCPDANGCYLSNPYKVDKVTIYFIERDFLSTNFGSYTNLTVDPDLLAQFDAAKAAACLDPSEENLNAVNIIQNQIDSSTLSNTFYYKDKVVTKIVGSEGFPAWLSTDVENSPLTLESTDSEGNSQFGHFSYEWSPEGSVRAGDYFICWTWTPQPSGSSLSAHNFFRLEGDASAVASVPTHVTAPQKYQILLERYTPEMYKFSLSPSDITPVTIDTFNKSVAQAFTFVEDMANQIIDLFDANVLNESMLVFLSNLFNMKLRSNDPTLWRRQIKQAIPLYKMKGTLPGLEAAFAQAGMELQKFTQYWQIVSPYTSTESFLAIDTLTFVLSKPTIVLPIDTDNFGVWYQAAGTSTYEELTQDYVTFDTGDDGLLRMTWNGDNLTHGAIFLSVGDRIKVRYEYNAVPDLTHQQIENYIQSLPLADQRNENDQAFPLKNWNVRLISEDDPLFPVIVPVRHPFQDPVVFGYVRTEFAYSENIYNMEEYNGSTRPSLDPCFIDKEFLDPCGACLGSLYSVDIGVKELSNDRMLEAQEILREFTPFHTQVHSLNFSGEVEEFFQTPVETIDFLVSFDYSQFVISGQANPIFNRIMPGGLSDFIITRQDLTDELVVDDGNSGIAYNDRVEMVAPNVLLSEIGIDNNSHIVEVLSPSVNAGTYTLSEFDGHKAKVSSFVIEPVDESAFTFRISNINYGNSVTSISQANQYVLTDSNVDFAALGVKTIWDETHTPGYTGGSWKITIPTYSASPYEILMIEGESLYLQGDSSLPATSATGVSYSLSNDNSVVIATSAMGQLAVTHRGYVNLHDPYLTDILDFIRAGDYLVYEGVEYQVLEFDGLNFWIAGYNLGDVAGASIDIRRRLVDMETGYFGYQGLRLTTPINYEQTLGIVNGHNPPPENLVTDNSLFKENFMFLIGGLYFKIAYIDGTDVTLVGRDQNWTTLAAGGTMVDYSVVHFPGKEVSVGFVVFDHLDHNGKDPVIREIESTVDENVAIVALSTSSNSGIQENTAEEEGISFVITRKDGSVVEGDI